MSSTDDHLYLLTEDHCCIISRWIVLPQICVQCPFRNDRVDIRQTIQNSRLWLFFVWLLLVSSAALGGVNCFYFSDFFVSSNLQALFVSFDFVNDTEAFVISLNAMLACRHMCKPLFTFEMKRNRTVSDIYCYLKFWMISRSEPMNLDMEWKRSARSIMANDLLLKY